MIAFLLLLLSIIIYVYSPNVYSYSYCILIFIVYLVTAIFNIRNTITNRNYFNFHILFSIGFLFVNFIYPIFIFPIDPEYFSVYKYAFNYNVITQATALALIGYCAYTWGVTFVRKRRVMLPHRNENSQIRQTLKGLSIVMVVTFTLILLFGGFALFSGQFGVTSAIPPGLLVFFQVIIGLVIILYLYVNRHIASIRQLMMRSNKIVLSTTILYFFIFLFVGDRGPALQTGLITLGAYSLFVRSMRLRSLAVIIVVGMFVMTFISYARSRDTSTSFISRGLQQTEITSFVDMGMDLIVTNRNLYVGYEYANLNGYSYGKGMFYYLFAPFPFVPSFLTEQLFNSTPGELTTAARITADAKAVYGLGTNIIADQYMEFGLAGVIIFMFILGFLVEKVHRSAYFGNSINAIIVYVFLVGISVYLSRTSVLEPVRFLVWGVFFYQLLKFISSTGSNKLRKRN